MGHVAVADPKGAPGGEVPSFIDYRRRSEQALASVIQQAVVQGVSTRKVEAVLGELGIARFRQGEPVERRTRRSGAPISGAKAGHLPLRLTSVNKQGGVQLVISDAHEVLEGPFARHVPKQSRAELSETMKVVFVQRRVLAQ